jgi:adenylosuccinate synthase
VKEKEYDDTQTVVQQALQQANGEINQLDPDLDALAQYLTTALKAVLDARDEEEEDDSIIEDTAQGTMLRLGKGIDYDPFFSSTTRRPAQGQSSEDRVKALFNRDLFWGSLLDEEE